MSHTSALTTKNQTTIPKAIVEALKVRPSATFCYEVEGDGSDRLTTKAASFQELAGTFRAKREGGPVSIDEMKSAVKSEAARRFRKAKPSF